MTGWYRITPWRRVHVIPDGRPSFTLCGREIGEHTRYPVELNRAPHVPCGQCMRRRYPSTTKGKEA